MKTSLPIKKKKPPPPVKVTYRVSRIDHAWVINRRLNDSAPKLIGAFATEQEAEKEAARLIELAKLG